MIYFDNAATTMMKPPQVAEAVARAINTFGGVGRGAHEAALSADLQVYRARVQIAKLFNGPEARDVAFGLNITESLNVAISGLVHAGDHAITTAASHNSVLRPLAKKHDEEGVEVTIVPIRPDGSLDYDAYEASFRSNTTLVVATHASNLTGDVYDIARMAAAAHDHGALFVIDAAQTAGVIPIDMQAQGIDIVTFTGHKSLYGPQGTGGLCLGAGVTLPTFKEGGSGTHSYDRRQPEFMPEHLEAGTQNGHGIAGLSAGLAYIEEHGVEALGATAEALAERFEVGVKDLPGVRIYGRHADVGRTGIVALNVGDIDSGVVSDELSVRYEICTRPGAHCAPLMHRALGTESQGAVRFSFTHFNTEEEVDAGIAAMTEIVSDLQ
jgi:cysteine desulfurase family protein